MPTGCKEAGALQMVSMSSTCMSDLLCEIPLCALLRGNMRTALHESAPGYPCVPGENYDQHMHMRQTGLSTEHVWSRLFRAGFDHTGTSSRPVRQTPLNIMALLSPSLLSRGLVMSKSSDSIKGWNGRRCSVGAAGLSLCELVWPPEAAAPAPFTEARQPLLSLPGTKEKTLD